MKCVVIFALLAVWISSSEATSCQDYPSCFSGIISLMNGSPSQDDILKNCRLFINAMTCANSALDDCRKYGNSAYITQVQQQIQSVTSLIGDRCHDFNGADALKVSTLILALALAVFNFVL